MTFFFVAVSILILVYSYMGWRLIVPSRLSPPWNGILWGVLILLTSLTPISFLLRIYGYSTFWSGLLSWIAFLSLGFFSLVFMFLIIKDLIEDIRIDALHSFENVSNSVVDYKKRFGDKITILGGVDMDKLTTLNENDLRKYVRNILDICMQGGRYALGAGNSISNYVPINNYLIMLDEGLSWH